MKHEIKDPSTTTEADRALRLRKDLADAQAKLREAEQWRDQAARAARLEREAATLRERVAELEPAAERAAQVPRLEREAATLRERVAELEGQVQRLRERPSPRQLQEAEDRAAALEARLRERPAQPPRHVERCAQAKLNRRLFQENERLKQEARNGL